MNKIIKTNKLLIQFAITLIGSILMVASVFLPYATAIGNHAESIKENPDQIVYEELDMTAEDMLHISMAEYANIYSKLSELFWGSSANGIFYVVMVSLIGGLALLAVLFSALKRPIAILVFDILSLSVFCLQNWDYTDRGVIPSSSYNWGIGYYIFYIAAIITAIGAIWLLISKIKSKKANKVEAVQ